MQKNNETGLARNLGLAAATITGLGVIIGSGIYVIIGVAAGQAGNSVWLSFFFAAIGASFTAISYARLERLHSGNAPEYKYVNQAFGSRPAFLAGWLILIAQIVSSAAVALGFAGYLNALLDIPELPAAAGLMAVCALVLYIGISQSAIIAIILTITEILGLIIVIGIGIPHFGSVDYFEMPRGLMGVLSAASLVFFAYLGFEGMANLSEEMKNPEQNLPKAISLALIISTVFYVLVSISAVSVVNWSELGQSNAPLALVAEQALGGQTGFVLTIISLASTANTSLLLLLAGSRVLHALACSGVLPSPLCVISKSRRTPWLAIVITALGGIAFISIGNIQQIAEFTNFITLLAFIGVNAASIRLFTRTQGSNPVSHILINRVVPTLGIIVSIWLAINAGWRAAVFGAIVLAAGFLAFWIADILRKR